MRSRGRLTSRTRVWITILSVFLCGLNRLQGEADISFSSDLPVNELVDHMVESMSDEELLGQVFLLGYTGVTPSSDILRWIEEKHIGGVKIFGWNAGELDTLAHSVGIMQERALENGLGIPLLVATDQEGGWVRHVKAETSITPGNIAIGAGGVPYDAYQTGRLIGMELRSLGINMNFAPTVDIYTNPEAHVIGPRAFSSDPIQTGLLAVAYYHGMESAGIICTAKHFPGHGNADEDSHGTLPVIDTTWEHLWETDLVPYRFLVGEGLPAIMSGHLAYPRIIGDETPSSLSDYFLTTVIRERLSFGGIVVTDDMRMAGVSMKGLGTAEVCKRALEAGNDMLMISRTAATHQEVWDLFYASMQEDERFRMRVIESATRILRVKASFLKGENRVPFIPDPGKIDKTIPTPEGKEFFFDQACRSTTVIRSAQLPIPEEGRILLAGQIQAFFDEGLKRYAGADTFSFPYTPFYHSRAYDRDRLKRIAEDYDTVIFCLANPNSLEVLRVLENADTRLVVMSALTPIYLRETPWIENAIAVYGTGNDSFRAGFAALKGDFTPEGRLPIRLEIDSESDVESGVQ